jgi:hypothetical protein
MGTLPLSYLMKLLVFLFFAGIVGSVFVVIVTFIEDAALLLEKDEPTVKRTDEDHHFPIPDATKVGNLPI